MAYDKKKIFEQAKEVITKHKLFFIEDVVAFLPISKPTFYDYFKVDSNEFNELKEMLEANKMQIKVSMRKKWHDSENATLQMGLMKLICTNEERKKLSISYSEVDQTLVDKTPPKVKYYDKGEQIEDEEPNGFDVE
jgi:predicted DNA-binding transcriptional regulator AlpA